MTPSRVDKTSSKQKTLGHPKRTKRQDIDWKKMFVNHISDKGLVCKTYKELSKLSSKNLSTPI